MRRQDIQLIALARQGDTAARCEAGRRYLLGAEGFPRHVATGIDYLTHANVRDLPEAARVIAQSLPLEELLALDQEAALVRAAAAGSAAARFKLGAWLAVGKGLTQEAIRWLEAAAEQEHDAARRALVALRQADVAERLPGMLRVLQASGDGEAPEVALIAARQALADRHLPRLAGALRSALALQAPIAGELAELLAAAARLAEQGGSASGPGASAGQPARADLPSSRSTTADLLAGLSPTSIEAALDLRAHRGDREAAYALGRALCGIDCGPLSAASLCAGGNMRKGVALLLRAADAGCEEAWLHLYRMHGDQRLSVANPQMARFCLEKAALGGQTEAQRKLGALMLRASDSLAESEQAIQWLHQAAGAGDRHAHVLLESLLLPLDGDDAEATAAIELVRRDDPWLAIRLQLSRQFGLTKLEALCVDPAEGLRPWGLVVGKNPFIAQIRLSAARAIPAVTPMAMETARWAASFFSQASRDTLAFEGDLRRRSLRQRRIFERHGLDESLFFATATSMTLEALRLGPKWAFRAKKPLQKALAA